MEKTLIVYQNNVPVLKFHVNPSHTASDIQSYFTQKFPGYQVTVFSKGQRLSPYDYDELQDGKIVLTRIGKIRIGQQRRAHSYPTSPGFTTIPAWSRGAGEWKQLSPFSIKFDDGVIFENFWQSFKVFSKVDAQTGVYKHIWKHPAEIHVDADGNPNEKWMKWHDKLMRYPEPVRRPNGRAIPLYAWWNGERLNDFSEKNHQRYTRLNTVEARRQIYIPYLQELYRAHPVYQKLLARVKSGENIMIVEPDGPLLEAYPNGMEVDLNKLRDLVSVMNYADEGYPERYRPYGHGYVIALTVLEDLELQ